MLNNDINFGVISSECFTINLKELSAQINQLHIEDEYNDLIEKFNSYAQYRFSYVRVPLKIIENECIFDCGSVISTSLSKVLNGCHEAIFLAVSVGIEADRFLSRSSIQKNSDAFLLDAIGSTMIESFADYMNNIIIDGLNTTKRFSPGYSDFPLSFQKILLKRLNSERSVGISLSEQLLMTPSKSITAIIGIY